MKVFSLYNKNEKFKMPEQCHTDLRNENNYFISLKEAYTFLITKIIAISVRNFGADFKYIFQIYNINNHCEVDVLLYVRSQYIFNTY